MLADFILGARVGLILVFMVYLIRMYIQLKYKTILFLISAVAFFGVHEYMLHLPLPQGFAGPLFRASIVLITVTWSLVSLLLFFESFNAETVLTVRNVGIFTVGTLLETSMMITNGLMVVISEHISNIFGSNPLQSLSAVDRTIYLVLSLSLLLSTIFVLYLVIAIFRVIHRKNAQLTDPTLKRMMRYMTIGLMITIIGPIISGIGITNNPNHNGASVAVTAASIPRLLYPFIGLIGLSLIIFAVHRGGLFLFQGETLRRLIIINNSGIPVYSYLFKSFQEKESLTQQEQQEVLFSGALKSISMLLGEFTGHNREVKEITLDQLVMAVENVVGFSVVLMTEHSSVFFHDALHAFTSSIEDVLKAVKPGMSFSIEQVKLANGYLENAFGFGYYHE